MGLCPCSTGPSPGPPRQCCQEVRPAPCTPPPRSHKAWKTPSRHPGAKPSPEMGCNKITHPSLEARVPTRRAGPKIHPVTLPGRQGCSAEHPREHPCAGLAHPAVGPCRPQDSTTGLRLFSMHTCMCIYTHTKTYSRKPAIRNKAGEAIAQAPNPPQPLSSHTRKDICARFHLKSGHAETVAAAA